MGQVLESGDAEGHIDTEALGEYEERIRDTRPRLVGRTEEVGGKARVRAGDGGLWVWKPPVRERVDRDTGRTLPAHRYVIAVDVSSGTSNDYTGVQVVDVDAFEQVAEFQAKMDPDLVAVEAARLGRIYNDALIAPEVTGGWGFSVVSELQRMRYPKLFTRRTYDRLSKRYTDKVGWDTQAGSRAMMLDTLERVIRDREFTLRSQRCLGEMVSFVWPDGSAKVPQAQPDCNDDLVMALAIAVYVTTTLPKELRRPKRREHKPLVAASTGY